MGIIKEVVEDGSSRTDEEIMFSSLNDHPILCPSFKAEEEAPYGGWNIVNGN